MILNFEDEIEGFLITHQNYGSLSVRDSLADVEIITFRDLKSFCFLPKNGRNFVLILKKIRLKINLLELNQIIF